MRQRNSLPPFLPISSALRDSFHLVQDPFVPLGNPSPLKDQVKCNKKPPEKEHKKKHPNKKGINRKNKMHHKLTL